MDNKQENKDMKTNLTTTQSKFCAAVIAVVTFVLLGVSGSCEANWADNLGEGSGVDRGQTMAVASSSPSAAGASAAAAATTAAPMVPDEAAMRAAMSNESIGMAQSFNFEKAVTTAYHTAAMGVQSTPATDGEGDGDDLVDD